MKWARPGRSWVAYCGGSSGGPVVLKGSETRAGNGARARTGSAATFELLRSKLTPPPERRGLVERGRIVDRLAHARGRRFVSVVAPPGYGKTTALSQWAGRDPRAFAWVSLDQRDNDPVVLFSYVAEALNADGSIARSVFKALAASGDSVWASGLPRLGAALGSRREPFVLVLDDVHVLQDHGCLDALAALALHVPAGSQLVFSGRNEPQVGLAKLRVDGELLELGSPDLALNDAEARALLTEAGVELTATETADLNRHTEGWAAGLYLAALSLSRGNSSVASFDGSDKFVTDYLRGEELSAASPDETEFLLRSAVLETMSGPLCDAVLQRSDSAGMLERLALENLFVVALDNTRSSFRYHHLFREMLLADLERSQPEVVTELRGRAAAWCEAHGRLEDAIEYVSACGDTDTLARLVAANAFPYYRSGRVSTVERWLNAFDEPELLTRHSEIAVFGTWLHALRGRPDAADRWALALEASEQRDAMPDGSPFDAWAAMVHALLCRGGIEQMRKDAELAIRELTPASPWRPASLLLSGVAALFLRDEHAETMLGEAAEAATAGGSVWAGVVARSELALLALDRGDLTSAEAEAALAGEFLDNSRSADYVVTAILYAVTAQLAIAQGKGARARQALAAAQRLRPMMTHAFSWFSVQVRLELASAHLALKDPRGAAMLHQETEAILRRRPRLGRLAVRAEQLRNEIAQTAEESSGWASTLTAAELRVLPLLTSHLTFREIAERLFVSRNTVKTQAISIYRKLDASSRGEAVERAVALGLVDAGPGSRTADFTRSG